jgi:hypothetical protein
MGRVGVMVGVRVARRFGVSVGPGVALGEGLDVDVAMKASGVGLLMGGNGSELGAWVLGTGEVFVGAVGLAARLVGTTLVGKPFPGVGVGSGLGSRLEQPVPIKTNKIMERTKTALLII